MSLSANWSQQGDGSVLQQASMRHGSPCGPRRDAVRSRRSRRTSPWHRQRSGNAFRDQTEGQHWKSHDARRRQQRGRRLGTCTTLGSPLLAIGPMVELSVGTSRQASTCRGNSGPSKKIDEGSPAVCQASFAVTVKPLEVRLFVSMRLASSWAILSWGRKMSPVPYSPGGGSLTQHSVSQTLA